MQEAFLHYVWKQKKFQSSQLTTVGNQLVVINSVGMHNELAGPDFFNSQMQIGNQLWAGNLEIHIKSSDWYVHNHENDKAYDNVILHVVWEHDADVYRKDNSVIPTLELKHFVNKSVFENYEYLLLRKKRWINCENDFAQIDEFLLNNWLERLYFERLEQKSEVIQELLQKSKNDWEAVLFSLLAKNFGLNINGDSFLSMSQSFDFSIIRKLQTDQHQLESLFLGQSGLLSDHSEEAHFNDLKSSFIFLQQKFNLSNDTVLPVQFFRLRPPNFPTIRLSQLASLYHKHNNLFALVIAAKNLEDFYDIFKVSVSQYWQTHYNFSTVSKQSKKAITKSFINLILINTIVPIKFAFAKSRGKEIAEEILQIMQQFPAEKNSIVSRFQELKKVAHSAEKSQALIQLKTNYCDKNKCLQCAIGNALIS